MRGQSTAEISPPDEEGKKCPSPDLGAKYRWVIVFLIVFLIGLVILFAKLLEVDRSASAPREGPDVTDEIFQQAVEREGQGNLQQAAALYGLVLEKQPERESASLRLSSLLYGQRRYEEAAEILRAAIKVHESAVLRNNLGTVYLAQGKLDLARQEFTAAAAQDAAYADPHYNLACYYALSGRLQEGLAELEKAKGMNPQVMEWAAQDGDLAALRAMPEYKTLTERP